MRMKIMTQAPLVAVLLLGCVQETPAVASTQACPPYSRAITVGFKKLEPQPIYNHNLSVSGIRNLFLTRGQSIGSVHKQALGVTYSEIAFYLEGDTSIVPHNGGYCVYLKNVKAEFGWKRMEVHVAMEYPTGTCEYNAILDHENQHVSIIKTALSDYAPTVRAELELQISRQEPIFTRRASSAADLAVEDLYDRMRGIVNRFQKVQAARHAAIDTDSNYGAIADLCPNWDRGPKRPAMN